MFSFTFKACPILGGFSLKTDKGVTIGYVTNVRKDMLNRWYLTRVSDHIHMLLGDEKVI